MGLGQQAFDRSGIGSEVRQARLRSQQIALSSVQTERWRLKFQKVCGLAGEFHETPVPHRFDIRPYSS